MLRSCSHGSFIWLQDALNYAVHVLRNFGDQDETAQSKTPQLHGANQFFARYQVLR